MNKNKVLVGVVIFLAVSSIVAELYSLWHWSLWGSYGVRDGGGVPLE